MTVSATDYGQPPNTATKQYQVAVTAGASDSLSYDDSGNTLAGAGRTYEWDSLDRMTAVTVGAQRTEFLYDGLGRRRKITEKTSGTVTSVKRLAYDGLDVTEERVDATNVLTNRFFGTGMQVLTGADAGRYIYTRDHLGSIRQHISATGTVLASYNYDPYGNLEVTTGPTPDFAYTGHVYHARSGLYFAPAREYSAELGRWMSRDPIEEEGGLNLYAYVENDPVNLIDLLGLDASALLERDYNDRDAPGWYSLIENGKCVLRTRANENPLYAGHHGVSPGDYSLIPRGTGWGRGNFPPEQPAITGGTEGLQPGQPNKSYEAPALVHSKGPTGTGQPDSRACITVDPSAVKRIQELMNKNGDKIPLKITQPPGNNTRRAGSLR